MSKVLVIDTLKQPLDPIHPARARQLLRNGQAAVFRRFPFTVVLKKLSSNQTVQPLRIKIDPGAKVTGIAVVNDTSGEVVWAGELQHRGFAIRESLTSRQSCRTDKYGFPNRHCARKKVLFGFQTGDIVKAIVTNGKKVGTYTGRIAVRATGSFNISAKAHLIQGISHRFCKIIHRKDGYGYAC